MVDNIRQNLPKGIDWSGNEVSREIDRIYEELFSDNSRIWCRSLAKGVDIPDGGAKEVLTTALRRFYYINVKIILLKQNKCWNYSWSLNMISLYLKGLYFYVLICIGMIIIIF